MNWQKEEFSIITDKSKMDISYIHDFLSNRSYWAEGITLDIVRRSIEGSLCFAMFHLNSQVGFARVITDKATFGYLADVFTDKNYRGLGLGKWLIEVIMAHPELQGLRNFWLGTRDAHGLYIKFGFKPIENPERMMRKNDPDVYRRKVENRE